MKWFSEIYLHKRFFTLLMGGVFALILAFIFPAIYAWIWWLLFLAGMLVVTDVAMLFGFGRAVKAFRTVADKFSNGEDNPVKITITNNYLFIAGFRVIDEVPFRFQRRDLTLKLQIPPMTTEELDYTLRPVKRGEYEFGKIRVFVATRLSLVERRYSFETSRKVAVYPSFVLMHKYELMAFTNRHAESGTKRMRIIGSHLAFEQIKPYIPGDDPRTVNWKATAKCNRLMVNTYTDERAQQVYCLVDKGRTMQSPFHGMSMLDYAINTTLALSNVVLKKGDKAGLLTFSNTPGTLIKADNRTLQLNRISEALYNQRTHYLETDFEQLCSTVGRQIRNRSLLVLFTNFDTLSAMQRHFQALRRLADNHLVLIVLFENTELNQVLETPAEKLSDVYFKTIAGSFVIEKRRIAGELKRLGIHTVLTQPESFTVNTVNAYLELKERGLI